MGLVQPSKVDQLVATSVLLLSVVALSLYHTGRRIKRGILAMG